MKILFLGDYSNMHACLAAQLRRRGHQCTVVSDGGGYMLTKADTLLQRKPGTSGAFRYLYDVYNNMADWKGYDIVQLNNPHFLSLRPGKLRYIFNYLLQNNGALSLTLASNDFFFVKTCLDNHTFRFSEFRIGNQRTPFSINTPSREEGWLRKDVQLYNEYLYSKISFAMSLLPEYDMAARPVLGDKCHFINLPVDISQLSWQRPDISDKINIFIGLSGGREVQKGTDILLNMARKLQTELPEKVAVIEARNMPLNDYLKAMKSAHIVLDQLYSYSPATNALQAMALGAVTASGAQPEYYNFIKEDSRPIIEASPLNHNLYDQLRNLVLDPQQLLEMSRQARKIVENHNDVAVVADKYLAAIHS